MGNLLLILGILFVGIIVMVNLAKWFGPDKNNPSIKKMSQWIIPLLMLSLVAQLIYHYLIK